MSGCAAWRFVFSAGSASRSNSCTGGSPCSSGEPGAGALRPPDPGARQSFHRPSRIASDPFPDWTTTAALRSNAAAGWRRSGRKLTLSSPASAGSGTADDVRERGEHVDEADDRA